MTTSIEPGDINPRPATQPGSVPTPTSAPIVQPTIITPVSNTQPIPETQQSPAPEPTTSPAATPPAPKYTVTNQNLILTEANSNTHYPVYTDSMGIEFISLNGTSFVPVSAIRKTNKTRRETVKRG